MMTTHLQQQLSVEELAQLLRSARSLRARMVAETTASAGPDDSKNDADRVEASVIRPLAMLLGETQEPPAAQSDATAIGTPDMTLWELTRRVTTLCAAPGRPAALIEAAAALQELACRSGVTEAGDRAVKLRALLEQQPPSIRIEAQGPLLVTNVADIHDWLGQPLPTRPLTALCRCGASAIKPYCDGSHARGFDDAKDAARVADRRDTYVGQQVTIFDNRGTCQHSGFCTDRLSTVFRLKQEPFAAPSGGRMDEIIRAVRDCPSGTLSYAIDGIKARGDVDRHATRPPSIEVSKDGPYRVTGAVALSDADGDPVIRNIGSAREAGLPNDAEFRSAFAAYVEWGSRLAVENSQTEARPPQHMPMPHWDWNTSAGPPGSRISALAPVDHPKEAAPILPGPDDKIEFGKHIAALFRERDRTSMKFAFDLASYGDVSTHADAILERVRNGTMPCDGAWPKERVDVFARWVAAGKAE